MASTYSKRLAKLEELLASRINQPLAWLWLNDGETREEACERAGYDPSMVDRIRFVRWMTSEEAAAAAPPSWEVAELGPPADTPASTSAADDAGQTVSRDAQHGEIGAIPVAREPDFEAENRYREAIEQREPEVIQEKLDAATKAFSRSIA